MPEALIDLVVPRRLRPLVTEVAGMGASVAQERLERFCRLETLRTTRVYAGRVSTVSAGTIDALLTSARKLFCVFNDLAVRGAQPAMTVGWELLPKSSAAVDLGAFAARLDRTAPPVALVSGALETLDVQALQGDPRVLRNRALLGLLACTGARAGAVSRLQAGDIIAMHRFPDGSRGPAARLRPGKTIPLSQHRWKALPIELHRWLHDHIQALSLAPAQPLFPRANHPAEHVPAAPESLTRILIGSWKQPGLLPREGGHGGYSAHTLRHLAAQLAHAAGRNHINHHSNPIAPTPEAFVASLLDHSRARDPLGYLDTTTETNRELTSRLATHAIWDTLRNPQPHSRAEVARLHHQRQALLEQPGTSTEEKLDTIIQAAKLTAQIDALLQPS